MVGSWDAKEPLRAGVPAGRALGGCLSNPLQGSAWQGNSPY